MAVRPFELTDIDGVNALHTHIHWPPPSADLWQWLASNPARGTSPMGWVIENDGRIDGFLGNFRQTYFRGSTMFGAATSHSIIVSPRAKGSLRALITPFLAQTDLFAVSILNANSIGSPIYRHFGLKPFVSPTHDVKLAWLLAPRRVVLAKALRSLAVRIPALYPWLGERFLPRAAPEFDPRQVAWPTNVHVIADLSDASAFGTFWQQLKGDGALVADRSPAMLRWRLTVPDLAARPVVLGYYDDQGLCAYAMAQLSKFSPLEVVTLEIIDLIALGRAPATAIPTLLQALKIAGRKMQAAKLRLPVVSAKTHAGLGHKVGLAHDEGGWGHAFAHFNAPESGFSDWQPTPFEGSYSFTLRQPRLR